MVDKKIFEDIIVHANICLKRWNDKGGNWDYEQLRGMILSWLNKAYLRTYSNYSNWRERRAASRNLSQYMHFTYDPKELYITSVTLRSPIDGDPLSFPLIDFTVLNKKANEAMAYTPALMDVNSINFETIETIKF